MPRCADCGRRFVGDQETCPACSQPLRSRGASADDARAGFAARASEPPLNELAAGSPLVPVARFANAAEAGYFAHELQWRQDVPVQLRVEQDFDALSGFWTTRYLLLVPEADGPSAALLLQRLVEQTDGDDPLPDEPLGLDPAARLSVEELIGSRGPAAAARPGVNWVPIVLTLAAGSAAFWGVRKLHDRPKVNLPVAPVGRHHNELWRTLAAPDGPWALQHDAINGTRELWIDTQRNVAVIREDADGDGRFERELHLRPLPTR